MVAISQSIGHLLHGHLLGEQHELGTLHPLAVDEAHGRHTHCMGEEAYEVALGDAGNRGQLVERDGLCDVFVDVAHHTDDALILSPYTWLGISNKSREERERKATQEHLVVERQLVVAFHTVGHALRVVITLRIARWQCCPLKGVADGCKGHPVQLINFNLRGEIIGIEQGSIVFELLVHMQVVERKVAVALIAVCHVGWHHVASSGVIAAGSSLIIEKPIALSMADARKLIKAAEEKGVKLLLPIDTVCVPEFTFDPAVVTTVCDSDKIPADQEGCDIGPKSCELFAEAVKSAKTVIWNGPMGVFEFPAFAKGTEAVAKALSETDAITIIGGGDSAAAVQQLGYVDKMTHISTGGGASLEFMEGKELPGVACLLDK